MKRIILSLTIMLWLAGAGLAGADDISVYGASTINVPPNVLIIFDTSGSMADEAIPGAPYDPDTVYAVGGYTNDAVYEWKAIYEDQEQQVCTGWGWRRRCHMETVSVIVGHEWAVFASSVGALNCSAVETQLSTTGADSASVGASPGYGCSGDTRNLATGNFLNYDKSGAGDPVSKLDVAKEVIGDLIDNTDNVRFGLMRFNEDTGPWWSASNQGGRIATNGGLGASKADLQIALTGDPNVSSDTGFTANGHTPLAETLAEAGLYFAGKASWFNSGTTYTSPVQYECQKNYIIFMTDGEPTSDDDDRLNNGDYINEGDGGIGDYDDDGSDTMNRLPDVAKYLYDNDILPDMGDTGTRFEKQNIRTFTIGFATDQALLQKAADDQHGHGAYYTTNSMSGLKHALQDILNKVSEVNSSFVSPVVPISRTNNVYAGDKIYLALFKPQSTGMWLGNLKRFKIDGGGGLIDYTNVPATDSNGYLLDTAQSWWSASADGGAVNAGGAGAKLLGTSDGDRKIYTNIGTSDVLTDASNSNAFTKANTTYLTQALLDVTTSTERDSVIDAVRGVDKEWKLGDILHSQPAVIHYGSSATMIYVGSNDGMLHCFNDADGSEEWAFIPAQQLSRLKLLADSSSPHDYFMDGTPIVYDNGSTKTLIVGERRGGYYYYALDVTDYENPKFLYSVGPTQLGTDTDVRLGQSWGEAKIAKIATNATDTDRVFLLPGGYDAVNEDLATPAATDTMGRAAFSVKVSDGATSSFAFNPNNFSALNHCITDLVGIDPDNDGITNRIYAPDLGGHLFAFRDDDVNGDVDGSWQSRDFFNASADSVQRKIFYAPDVIKINSIIGGQEMLFFGTGDRANPNENTVTNRFYGVKNDWTTGTFTTLTESNIFDVTDDVIQMGDADQRAAARTALESGSNKGWYIKLGAPGTDMEGEKVLSSPIVFSGIVYFTTYVPNTTVSTEICDPGVSGTSYLYAVDYKTGAAVYSDFYPGDETNGDGNTVETGVKDRRIAIGRGITETPVIWVHENGVFLGVQVEEGFKPLNITEKVQVHTFYWRDR